MGSSTKLDFNLQLLLEQLDQDELVMFKYFLRTFPPPSGLQQIPPTEVEEADAKQLAEILINTYPSSWVETVTIQALIKMSRRYKTLIPLYNPKALAGPFPHTVVLQGAAGVGKTTLAKKLMLDWTEDELGQTFRYAFYLCCRRLNCMGPCTFAELVLQGWPALPEAIADVLAQPQKVLFVVDGFDELRVPPGALIHDLCGDWRTQKPVPVLLGSLLKRKMCPKATLLVTTRPWALRELRLLVEQPVVLEVEGFSESDREEYFLKHFEDEAGALRALAATRSNAALFGLGAAPPVCWIICSCLKLQMLRGQDPTLTCQTTTSLFLRFLCGQFTPTPGAHPTERLQAPMKALCLLAVQGIWARTSTFDGEDLRRLGLEEGELGLFLDKSVLLRDRDCEGAYCFAHLSVQQFLAAVFYLLGGEEEDRDRSRWDIGDVEELLSKEERLKNPSLTQVGYFLFGLFNEERVKELETTFGCQISMEVKRQLLRCKAKYIENKPFPSMMGMKELFYCLYESQEEEFVKDFVGHLKEMSLHLKDKTDIVHSSFCLKHCPNLQKISLQVEKGLFLENDAALESDSQVRSQIDRHILPFWTDLCSVFATNNNLIFLDISESFLSNSSVRILCENIVSATCNLQKVVLKNIFPVDAYQNLCLTFSGQGYLTHLNLQGNDHIDMLPLVCEVLQQPKCNLQYLRLESCLVTTQQWADLFSTLRINQSLMCLNLTSSELSEGGVRLLCATLTHPKCSLQRLSLESCRLTEACCEDLSSALVANQRLTHLCLAKNDLGDEGVKLLCKGLSHPNCKLQRLVLWCCNITEVGCDHLSKLLQRKTSLTHLDLGLNRIGTIGLKSLCKALKEPLCSLKCLWLWGCALPPFSCMDLSSALSINQSLISLDLGQNTLGHSGIMILCEALKLQTCPLQTLRLKIDAPGPETQKLLNEVRESNPQLTIESETPNPREHRPSSCDFLF
ncbi:NACHT, LRR and PYD domains-containing protein 2 [Dasypus novemcinctus]|uniref:NACHT, LRR and PYD domains-containing protein 2 n=1 Tax=Dasypus novemcinctus TaxID=9361 RepID=UPI0026604F34|nr:NACHT, LRR and PYD domains-containing protein 2 [Dasypus novemcinctus]